MANPPNLVIALKALRQLGPGQLAYYAWHQAGLRSGWLRRRTPADKPNRLPENVRLRTDLLPLPSQEQLFAVLGGDGWTRLLAEANEIADGQVRLFGGEPVPLEITFPEPLQHWTAYQSENGIGENRDIKLIWEPGRFGWAYTLGRAYHLSGDERYAQAFWNDLELFLQANPPNRGPHWISAQEVALRLMAFVFAAQVFAASPTSTLERMVCLAQAVADHAGRIPPTLSYAQAQNNNHLLSEAAGLYTAGLALPDHPAAARWRELGWRLYNRGLQSQVADDGTYIQHSANYHRLMLQLALWTRRLAGRNGQRLPGLTRQKLSAAVRWLAALLDPDSGQVPNLGPNDGAYVFPLASAPFNDYRPALQAAGLAFLGERLFASDSWDEMSLWMVGEPGTGDQGPEIDNEPTPLTPAPCPLSPHIIRLPNTSSWSYLRAARFTSRPGHADQLHVDLWWRGLNVAQDAGTYRYNAPPPWDNALACTAVHNTVTVNGQEQMTWAGRFLWLDWAQARVTRREAAGDGAWERLEVEHDGYRGQGVRCLRRVTGFAGDHWEVQDQLLRVKAGEPAGEISVRLHWLLIDGEWRVVSGEQGRQDNDSPVGLEIKTIYGWISIKVSIPENIKLARVQLVRAGELLHGEGPIDPTWGWTSPTYSVKTPALSFSLTVQGRLPFALTTEFHLPSTASTTELHND
jgi:hypothetical protein